MCDCKWQLWYKLAKIQQGIAFNHFWVSDTVHLRHGPLHSKPLIAHEVNS